MISKITFFFNLLLSTFFLFLLAIFRFSGINIDFHAILFLFRYRFFIFLLISFRCIIVLCLFVGFLGSFLLQFLTINIGMKSSHIRQMCTINKFHSLFTDFFRASFFCFSLSFFSFFFCAAVFTVLTSTSMSVLFVSAEVDTTLLDLFFSCTAEQMQ